ncbi:hypothetical protein HU200_021133 [Digitaria exilis]|uniref:DUF3741 domain-containing protein n=1 Tax=Digitaria exilis TaxID=1010633 RepID=A0A835KDY2_9POAL|nr:hypothetical protein HU200_021133 [Digitaria exilis]CAB3472720.1 unnamed protein product [Digitaria exilis]
MLRRRRGIPSFCHGVASTSTVHQLHGKQLVTGNEAGVGTDTASSSFLAAVSPSVVGSCVAETEVSGADDGGGGPEAVTLEQMILQLDLEEEAARKARRATGDRGREEEEEEEGWFPPRRMSCVDGGGGPADQVLRSARDALSQYPRFSLDGRDAMHRASFSGFYNGVGRDATAARASAACCAAGAGCSAGGYEMDLERTLRMPATVAGESVVWCKPGVVAKLMGLEAVPVPVKGGLRRRNKAGGHGHGHAAAATTCGSGGVRKHRVRSRAGQEAAELMALNKEKLFMALHGYDIVGAAAGARHAGTRRSGVGPDDVSGMGDDDGNGWEFRFRR